MKKNDKDRPNYFFILTAGRYMYDDSGEKYSLDKMKLALMEHVEEIKVYPKQATDETIISETKKNDIYRFFNRAILVDIKSDDAQFNRNNYSIVSFKSFTFK